MIDLDFAFVPSDLLSTKDVYVWDTGRRAIWVFSALVLRGVDVAGFVTNFDQFVGDAIVNRPIISLEEFSAQENAVAIVDDEVNKGAFSVISGAGEAVYYSDALVLNPLLRDTAPYVFNLDDSSWSFTKTLGANGVDACGYIVKRKRNCDRVASVPVVSLEEGLPPSCEVVAIPYTADRSVCDSVATLVDAGFEGTVIVLEIMCHNELWAHSLIHMLDAAVKGGKRILLCCDDALSRRILHRMLRTCGVFADREVCFRLQLGCELEDIWALADEDPNESVLVLGCFNNAVRSDLIDAAYDLNYSAGDLSCAGLQKICHNANLHKGILVYEPEPKLIGSIDYSVLGGLPGWMVHGNEEGAELRILVLGGSTSTDLYYPESWVSKLSKMLRADGVKAVIYNGANEANDAMCELIRLARSIYALKPDFVISLSGVNDLKIPDCKFERIADEAPFERWVRMERYIKAVAEAEGATCIPILQPMNTCMHVDSLVENMFFIPENHKWGKSFLEGARDDDFYWNLLDLFHHREGMYIDRCHYTDQANQELAERIYEILKGEM